MLSFILFFDGPCDESSFKPDALSQHWGRRDAITRCATMALYPSSNGIHSCDDCYYVFYGNGKTNNDNKSNVYNGKDCSSPAVIVIDGHKLVSSIIPTERSIVKLMRESARLATSNSMKMPLLSNDKSSSITCSYTPWSEAILIRNKASVVTSSTTNTFSKRPLPIESQKTINVKRQKASSHQSFDKRTLLKIMHQECSIEFLRKHELNGSEAVVLKKKNMAAIEKAFNEWNENNTINTDNSNDNIDNNSMYNNTQSNLLVDTLRVLLYRILKKLELQHKNKSITITVLLLHENADHELAIFGNVNFVKKETTEETINHTVAILGGVRDMTRYEVECVVDAAESMGLKCVGANLGKVAEFTSKIICAMNAHTFMGTKMSHVVNCLPPLKKDDAMRFLSKDLIELSETASQKTRLYFHCILRINLSSTEVSSSLEDRPKMHPIIQALVCCLWRSRLAKAINSSDHDNDDNDFSIHTDLTLIFSDNIKVTVSQRSFLSMMADQHMSAPSEYQVMLTFCSILSSNASERYTSGYSCLKSLLPTIEQENRKITDLFVIDLVNDHAGALLPNIADGIYSRNCFCTNGNENNDESGRDKYLYLFLNNDTTLHDSDIDVDYILNEWKYGSKKADKRLKNQKASKMHLKEKLFSNEIPHNLSPGCVITVLLHWSYHGLLIPTIKETIKKNKNVI